MSKFSVGQLKAVSAIFGSIAVAWFTAGVIGPLFTSAKDVKDFVIKLFVSLIFSGLFSSFSLLAVKGVKT